jgi:hypothetical protein
MGETRAATRSVIGLASADAKRAVSVAPFRGMRALVTMP